MKKVNIIILNWNGWRDTIECLESIFRLNYPNFRVIVCDNDSTDKSVENIKAWANGYFDVYLPQSNPLRQLSFPPINKPLSITEYTRSEAESGGNKNDEGQLALIHIGSNNGFAAGNNVGLRYVMARGDFGYVWILNNDTVVKPESLFWMVKEMGKSPNAGMCGSKMPYYYDPDTIWCLGGASRNNWTMSTKCIGLNESINKLIPKEHVETQMAFIAGASILVSREFIKEVGFMGEEYFLYYEEIDWIYRGRNKYNMIYSPNSIVYHKVGKSTEMLSSDNSDISEYYTLKSLLIFTRKFFPAYLPIAYLRVAVLKTRTKIVHLLKKIKPLYQIYKKLNHSHIFKNVK
jgi:GT2 family glycosyltransferase